MAIITPIASTSTPRLGDQRQERAICLDGGYTMRIINRFNGKFLFEVDTLSRASLIGADLVGADLEGAIGL